MTNPVICPRCGTANAPGSQYCDQCSLPLSLPARAEGTAARMPAAASAPVPPAVVPPPAPAPTGPVASAPPAQPAGPAASAPPTPAAPVAPTTGAPVPASAPPEAGTAVTHPVPAPARGGGIPMALIGGIAVAVVLLLVGAIALVATGAGQQAPSAAPTPNLALTVNAAVDSRSTQVAATALAMGMPTDTLVPNGTVVAAAPGTATAASNPTTSPAPAGTQPVAAGNGAPTATPMLPGLAGNVRFVDKEQVSNEVVVRVAGLTAHPPGQAFFAWLSASDGSANQLLGRLVPEADGDAVLTFDAPQGANLVTTYDRLLITLENPEAHPTAPSTAVVAYGQVPPQTMIHVRHLLSSFPETPNKIGLEVGLRAQAQILLDHANFMGQSQASGDLAGVKLHAEHLVNIVEGAKGADFGDLNHDGKVTNPGDGFGLLPNGDSPGYLLGTQDHADLAAAAPDATQTIKNQAAAVDITIANANGWVTTIRDQALAVLKAPNLQTSKPLVDQIVKLAGQVLNGAPGADGQVRPVKDSGGVLTGYAQAQLMAGMDLQAGAPPPGTPGTPADGAMVMPAATPTATPAPVGSGAQLTVTMKNMAFGDGPLTVKVGTTVTWVNGDNVPHTTTADNGAWDSGVLQPGERFSFTFKQAGRVPYYCALHGGPGGQGMASTVIVQP